MLYRTDPTANGLFEQSASLRPTTTDAGRLLARTTLLGIASFLIVPTSAMSGAGMIRRSFFQVQDEGDRTFTVSHVFCIDEMVSIRIVKNKMLGFDVSKPSQNYFRKESSTHGLLLRISALSLIPCRYMRIRKIACTSSRLS
jgi:hypothetical protein